MGAPFDVARRAAAHVVESRKRADKSRGETKQRYDAIEKTEPPTYPIEWERRCVTELKSGSRPRPRARNVANGW